MQTILYLPSQIIRVCNQWLSKMAHIKYVSVDISCKEYWRNCKILIISVSDDAIFNKLCQKSMNRASNVSWFISMLIILLHSTTGRRYQIAHLPNSVIRCLEYKPVLPLLLQPWTCCICLSQAYKYMEYTLFISVITKHQFLKYTFVKISKTNESYFRNK